VRLGRAIAWVALGATLAVHAVAAHAGLAASDPIEGAVLGAGPDQIRLTFSERPEPRLSVVRVLDTGGRAFESGRPQLAPKDPLSLVAGVQPLERGVYTVRYRVVSAVDGHVTEGAYAFGVLADPGVAAGAPPAAAPTNPIEILARWTFLTGLVLLLGGASATAARFGSRLDLSLSAAGWTVAVMGLALLVVTQQRSAAAPIADLVRTSIGMALVWRAAALAVAAGAILTAWSRPATARPASIATACGALAAMAAHAAAGHAAAADQTVRVASIGAQWVHFAAAGVWFGGLAALLLSIRGGPSDAVAASARRFSRVAAAMLAAVVATGVLRAIGELSSWRDLLATGYGRAVAAKIALVLVIVGLAAVNRRRSVPAAAADVRPLRRTGGVELVVAAGVLLVSATLGTLPPPSASARDIRGVAAEGADFGTTVRVRLATASDRPGPNRFTVHVADYDSGLPVRDARVSLRFTPPDDPGEASTTLALAPAGDGVYAGSGANLAFDGRWRVAVLVERGGRAVQAPLEFELAGGPPPFVSVERPPGRAPRYLVQAPRVGFVRFALNPGRAGPITVELAFFDVIQDFLPIESVVLTSRAEGEPVRQVPTRRLDRNTFLADVELGAGRHTLAAVGRAETGARIRASIDIPVPGN
jgi:copper transport protein